MSSFIGLICPIPKINIICVDKLKTLVTPLNRFAMSRLCHIGRYLDLITLYGL